MKDKRIKATICLLLGCCMLIAGCEKYLDPKPDQKLVVPKDLKALQALMDNSFKLNIREPVAGEVSSDDYQLKEADYLSVSSQEYRRMYRWEKDFLFEQGFNSWIFFNENIYFSNTVLEELPGVHKVAANAVEWDNIRGQAYVFRAKNLLQAAFLWCMAYEDSNAGEGLGLPLRLSTDFNVPSVRSSVHQTYGQVIADLKAAVPLLPVKPAHVMRPSRPAAYALLARTYLSMRKYAEAGLYADSCLQLQSAILDFNTLTASAAFPVKRFNTEVIFSTAIPNTPIIAASRAAIVPELIGMYDEDDLRKSVFFRNVGGAYQFKGSYEGNITLFGGLATDEMYLIRSESNARAGNIVTAMGDIRTLLLNRYKTGTYAEPVVANAMDALQLILRERRKELVMRGIRWTDIKRLNLEGANIVLTRKIGADTFTLLPNDLRYALPLPESLLEVSELIQNPR